MSDVDVPEQEQQTGEGSPVESPVAESPDYSVLERLTLADLKALSEKNPVIREYREQGFEAGRQKRERELRMEQGSREAAEQYHRMVIDMIEQGKDLDEIKRTTPVYVAANEARTRAELSRALIEQSIEALGDDPAAQSLRSLTETLEGKPEELLTVAQAALNAVSSRAMAQALADFDPEGVSDNAPVRAKLIAWRDREVAAELKAREIEAKKRENPPEVPTGNGQALSALEQLQHINDSERRVEALVANPGLRARAWDEIAASKG